MILEGIMIEVCVVVNKIASSFFMLRWLIWYLPILDLQPLYPESSSWRQG
jgi:hypothetical protein